MKSDMSDCQMLDWCKCQIGNSWRYPSIGSNNTSSSFMYGYYEEPKVPHITSVYTNMPLKQIKWKGMHILRFLFSFFMGNK